MTKVDDIERYRCGDWEIDLGHRLLKMGSAQIALRPKAFSLLAHLIRHRDKVVSSSDLFEAVWPGVHVSEATLASTLRAVREVLSSRGDTDEGPGIVTIRGRGYRFEGHLEPLVESTGTGFGWGLDDRPPASVESPFFGRRELLSVANGFMTEALAGRSRALMLDGEAGIGKSRALREMLELASRQGLAVHAGRCLEEDGAPPCWPWTQILRSLMDSVPPAKKGAFVRAHGAALALVPELSTSRTTLDLTDESVADGRFRLFDAVARLVRALAALRPRAILIDDLHRADVSTALLLRHLMSALTDAPVVFIGALRGQEIGQGHPLTELLSELHGTGRRYLVAGLDSDDVGRLLESAWGHLPLGSVVDAVRRRSSGNPLFVVEIARMLDQEGATESIARAEAAAPEGIRQLFRSRVSRMAVDGRSVLEVAAVLGREFDIDVLRRVCADQGHGAPESVLEEAAELGFLVGPSQTTGEWRFAHILNRDALYDDLPLERRSSLHRSAADSIESLFPLDLHARADELANHFAQSLSAGSATAAQRYARLAGDRAFQRSVYDEAAERFELALLALGRREGVGDGHGIADWAAVERVDLQIQLGRARWNAGARDLARDIFREAGEGADALGQTEFLGRAALGYAGRTDAAPGVNRTAVALMQRALDKLSTDDGSLRAELLARLGSELYHDADRARCEKLTSQAVEMAERVGEAPVLAFALTSHHNALNRADVHPRNRMVHVERLIDLASESNDDDVLAIGYIQRVNDQLEIGDRGDIDESLKRFCRLADESGQPFFQWMASAFEGMSALLDGRLEEAERRAYATLELCQRFSAPNALPLFAGQLVALRSEQGRLSEIEPLLNAAIAEQEVYPSLRAALALTQASCGRRIECAALLTEVMSDDLESEPRDQNWLALLGTIATAAVEIGHEALMAQVQPHLAPFAGRIVVTGHGTCCYGAVDHHLGRLAAGLGDVQAAEEHFEAAELMHRGLRAPIWLAHTRREHAGAIWKSGAPRDRSRARAVAAEASGTYSTYGLHHRIEQMRLALR